VLLRLDEVHKKRVLELVYALGLIEKGEPLLDLSNASLDRARLSELTLHNVGLKGANLRQADLYGADLEGSDLSQADLRGANMSGANLSGVDLTGANLLPYDEDYPARWSLHNLGMNIDLNKEDFLPSKHLVTTNLSEAILSEAQLCDAWLGGVNLRGAKVRSADLTRAQLKGADLSYADLEGAKRFTTEAEEPQAQFFLGTTMPDGQKYEEWLKSKGSGEDRGNRGLS